MRRWLHVFVIGALAGCDAFFQISGHVTRCTDGQPLVGVELQLSSDHETETAYTDPDGSYEIALDAPPDVTGELVLDKPGYVTEHQTFPNAPSQPSDFCLAPASM